MIRYVDCPIQGKCGHRRHIDGSDAYRKCLRIKSQMTLPMWQEVLGIVPSAPSYDTVSPDARRDMEEALELLPYCDSYQYPASYIPNDMSFGENDIQTYLNSGSSFPLKEGIENNIKNRIKDNLNLVAEEIDFAQTGEEFNAFVDMVFDHEKANILKAIAANNKPRTFTHATDPNYDFLYIDHDLSGCDVGSDEWFDKLARKYHANVLSSHLRYEQATYSRSYEKAIENDRQAIMSALKDAMGDDIDEIGEDYILPDFRVVWTGELVDVIPDDKDYRTVAVESPHFILTRGGERLTDPAPLSGVYRISIPDKRSCQTMYMSEIVDDMSSDYPYFDYTNNAAKSQYSSPVTPIDD